MALEKRANKGGGGASQHVFKTPGRVEFFDQPIIIIDIQVELLIDNYNHFDI